MIDPVIFTIPGLNWPVRWYGVIVIVGVFIGSWIVEREIKRRGENGDRIWDALLWILIPGILGARLWFVMNETLDGNRFYIENPASILKTWEGGLHIYGGLLLGAIALLIYLRKNNLDYWLFLDAAGPALLIGQAIGRVANFINQELYGQPTDLPWGIPIDLAHRLPQFANLPESVRFHPTFAYEMLWNFAAAGFLIWFSRRYEKELKPGTIFAGWLMLAGVGRVWIEFFRPDQPKIGDSPISYSMVAAAVMAVAGAILLMIRYKAINLAFAESWEDEYRIAGQVPAPQEDADEPVEEETPPVKRASTRKAKTQVEDEPVKKTVARRKTADKTSPKKTSTRTKKSQ